MPIQPAEAGEVVYKVVAIKDRKYVSCLAFLLPKSLTVTYRIGKVSVPPAGYLMAFENKSCAIRHARNLDRDNFILRCRAGVNRDLRIVTLPDIRTVAPIATGKYVRMFWRELSVERKLSGWDKPLGTVFCSWILPEEVEDAG